MRAYKSLVEFGHGENFVSIQESHHEINPLSLM
jgi:hypothetical protein